MFWSYYKIVIRNIRRYKVFTFLNIFGLTLGLTGFMLMMLFVKEELSYDIFHEKADNIYRITERIDINKNGEHSASVPFPFGPTMAAEFPEYVKYAVRFFNFQSPSLSVGYNNKHHNEKNFFFVDKDVFKVFDFPLHQGNPDSVLAKPNTVVITKKTANKYFGKTNPVGKVLIFEGQTELLVTGVLNDLRQNSHIKYDFLASFSTLKTIVPEERMQGWYWNPCWTYFLANDSLNVSELKQKMSDFVIKYFDVSISNSVTINFQPLTDIHLFSSLDYEISENGSIEYVMIFIAIAMSMLFVAATNFANLTTANASKRAKEIGVRKVIGASKKNIRQQIMGEGIAMSLAATIFAVALTELLLPFFNEYTGQTISPNFYFNWKVLSALLIIAFTTGYISGIYPAMYMSRFSPMVLLIKELKPGKSNSAFRQIIVSLQFTVAIVLVIVTMFIYLQFRYLQNAKLGFDKEKIVLLPIGRSSIISKFSKFASRLMENRNIKSVTATEDVLGVAYQTGTFLPETFDEPQQFPRIFAKENFASTFGIELLAGRDFSYKYPSDSLESVLINMAMVQFLGWKTPKNAIGKTIYSRGIATKVVGVVANFNFASLHQNVGPFVIDYPDDYQMNETFMKYAVVRFEPKLEKRGLVFLKRVWKEFEKTKPIEFKILRAELAKLYSRERAFFGLIVSFSVLTLIIAFLGLWGLTAFMVNQRKKEIGVKKVFGASPFRIVMQLSGEFLKLVAVANILAYPLAWTIVNLWLNTFAYHVEIQRVLFIPVTVFSFTIPLVTIGFRAYKTIRQNPIQSLRYE